MRCANLLPVPVLAARSRSKRIRRWMTLLSIEAVALAVACLLLRGDVAEREATPREVIQATVAQIDLLHSAIARETAALGEVEQRTAISRAVTSRPDWSIVLALIARRGDGLIKLDSCQLAAGMGEADGAGTTYRLSLVGSTRTQEELTEFVESLKETGAFTSVRVMETRRVGNDAETAHVRFMIEGVMSAGGAT